MFEIKIASFTMDRLKDASRCVERGVGVGHLLYKLKQFEQIGFSACDQGALKYVKESGLRGSVIVLDLPDSMKPFCFIDPCSNTATIIHVAWAKTFSELRSAVEVVRIVVKQLEDCKKSVCDSCRDKACNLQSESTLDDLTRYHMCQ